MVSRHVVHDPQQDRTSALALEQVLGLGSYQTVDLVQKLRRAMVRPGRDQFQGA